MARRFRVLPEMASGSLCRFSACLVLLTFISVGAAAHVQSRDLASQCADAAAAWWQGRQGIDYEAIEPARDCVVRGATRQAPHDGDVWAALARAYGKAEQFQDAWTATDKAIEHLSPAGYWERGKAYHYGDGVDRQPNEAAEWYRKAAEQGHMRAILDFWEAPDALWKTDAALDLSGESRTADLLIEQLDSGRLEWRMLEELAYLGDGRVVEWLIRRLSYEDRHWRELAARALGLRGEPRAVEPLAQLLDDDASSVRHAAVRALGQIGGRQAAGLLARRLVDGDLRTAIAYALAALGDLRASEPLIALLRDEDADVREAAAESLGALGDPKAVEPLIERLRDEDEMVRWEAAESLGALGDPRAVEPLIALLRDDEVHYAAAQALGALGARGDARVADPLLALLRDDDWSVRVAAAEVLGATGDPRAVDPLIALLRDDETEWVRHAAAEALGAVGEADIEGLTALAREGHPPMREWAAEALGALGDPRAIDPLLVLLRDEEWLVRHTAVTALVALGESGIVEALIALARDDQPPIRVDAAHALGGLEDRKAIDPLLALLRDEDWEVRYAAARALGVLGKSGILEALLALSRHDDPAMRREATDALGEFGDARAVDPLLVLLRDEDWEVRYAAADALGALGHARAVDPLLALLRDEHWLVRKAAATALGGLGDPTAINPLLALLRDEDLHVRYAAAEALGTLADLTAVDPLLALLGDEDWIVQDAAAEALAALGESGIAEMLMALARDDQPFIRLKAAKALGVLGGLGVVDPLMELARDDHALIRLRAAEALGRLGDPRAIDPLVALARVDDGDVRAKAAKLLGALGDPRAIDPLVGLARVGDPVVRAEAAKLLGALGDRRAIDPLVALIRNEDSGFVRGEAVGALVTLADALGARGDPKAVDLLVVLVRHKDWFVRETGADALTALGHQRMVGPLIALLRDEDRNVREATAEALGALRDPSAFEPLLALVRDEHEDPDVRREAAAALAALEAPRSTIPLIALFGRLWSEHLIPWKAAEALLASATFSEAVVATPSVTERTEYLGWVFAAADEYSYSVLSLCQKLTVRRPDLYDELRLPALRHIWSWRYSYADVPQAKQLDEDLLRLSASSQDEPSAYALLLVAILAIGDQAFEKALTWSDQGIARAEGREVALRLALSVVKAESLAGLDRLDEALHVIDGAHGELKRLLWREREAFPDLESEVLTTRGFVLSKLGQEKGAIETLDRAEAAVRRARWSEFHDDDRYERMLGARIAPIRARAYRAEAERNTRLANAYFKGNAPRGIQEEHGWEALTGQRIERALEGASYDLYVKAHEWVESRQLGARESGEVRFADEDRQVAYNGLAKLNNEIATLKREIEVLERPEWSGGSGQGENLDEDGNVEKRKKADELRRKRAGLRRFVRELKTQFPDIAAMWAAAPTDVAQLHENLDPTTGIIQYLILENESYAFVILDDDIVIEPLRLQDRSVGRDCPALDEEECINLEGLVREYSLAAETVRGLQPADITYDGARSDGQLSEILLDPIARHIADLDHLIIVPNGILHRVAFAALPLPLSWEEDGFLIQHKLLTVLPAASLVGALLAKPLDKPSGLLALGNPRLEEDSGLPALEWAEEEVESLEDHFPGLPAKTLLTGDKARLDALVGKDLQGHILHFAAHAEGQKGTREARLLLSGGDLTYSDVLGLDIGNAPLVVLSACDTGRGDIRSGDEVYSLANAFMHAQARAVVFTLWPVDDQATRELMGEFYSEFERTGDGAVALADAQRAMIKNGYSTELWAGFVFSAWSAPRSP